MSTSDNTATSQRDVYARVTDQGLLARVDSVAGSSEDVCRKSREHRTSTIRF
jgi:hypothetical protein